MSSYAELLAVCTEFQENFASLNGKYNAVVQELENEKAMNEKITKQLETMRSSEDKLHQTIRELKKELDEAHSYKDRYLAATVTVEHLKGRLENARHAVADKILEHEQQVEQLRGQIKDLLQRVSVVSDAAGTQELKKQVVELEERCAHQSANLIEEKERASQQLLTAHAALRETQTRQLELEQRCRTLEAEIIQMRSIVRRSSELQNDAAVAREKSAAEARRVQITVESLTTELNNTQTQLREGLQRHAEEMEAARAAAEETQTQLLQRVSELSLALDEAAVINSGEREKGAVLQRAVRARVEAARAEGKIEAAALQKSLTQVRAELQTLTWRNEQIQIELEESQRTLQQRETRLEKCNEECQQLRAQLETLVQKEAWRTAEYEHCNAQLQAARQQAQELAAAQRANEESGIETDRLRLQLKFLEDELQETRRVVEAMESRVKDTEEAAERRLRALRHELANVKKHARADKAKADAVRRRLVQALLEKEAELPALSLQQQQQKYHRPYEGAAVESTSAVPAAGLDVLTLLRGQNEQAAALHHRLIELSSGLPMKAKALKELLRSRELTFLMEAHNGLSARVVEEAGFKAIWASGLSISAQMGFRDNNEASWTQVCGVAECMSDVTRIPILLDADTGYGNFNNARVLVRKLEKIGVAGACVEDKLFPKTNSLLDTTKPQPLADVEEFALKIRAMKDTQTDDNFCVVARVESFIAGWPTEEALRRATAYVEAGADAILVHSRKKDASEIEAFMHHWKDKAPVVIVPTNYATVPASQFRKMGISSVIWANHNLRSSIKAMQETSRKILEQESVATVENEVVSVKEVFRLQGLQEYVSAEEKYLPKR